MKNQDSGFGGDILELYNTLNTEEEENNKGKERKCYRPFPHSNAGEYMSIWLFQSQSNGGEGTFRGG